LASALNPPTAPDLTSLNLGDTGARTRDMRIAQLRLPDFLPDVEASASFSDCAHSSQHTSTVFPPIFTFMELASSSQSQAAQVFAVMGSISLKARHPGGDRKSIPGLQPLSKSLAKAKWARAGRCGAGRILTDSRENLQRRCTER
jgi:hypothetical protein